jgi:hypothetical protein
MMELTELEQYLVVISTAVLSYDELDPPSFAGEIARQYQMKRLPWQDGQNYLPNIIHIFVPPLRPKELEEVEAIFNSSTFLEHIYTYVGGLGCKLFDFLRVEIDVLPGMPIKRVSGRSSGRCLVRMEWPNTKQSSSGLDVVVEANAQKILRVALPKPEIDHFALLQPINARTYRDHYLIIKKQTHLGRARNVIGGKGELVLCNDFAFARTSDKANKTISRQHALIEFRDGDFYLIDSGSRSGTAIQRFEQQWHEIAVPQKSETGVRLADRDIIRLGSALLSFESINQEQLELLSKRRLLEGRFDIGMINASTGDYQQLLNSFARYVSPLELSR